MGKINFPCIDSLSIKHTQSIRRGLSVRRRQPETLGERGVLGAAKADVGIMLGGIAFRAKGGSEPIGLIDV